MKLLRLQRREFRTVLVHSFSRFFTVVFKTLNEDAVCEREGFPYQLSLLGGCCLHTGELALVN